MDDEVVNITHSLGQETLRFYAADDSMKLPYWSENNDYSWSKVMGEQHGYMYYNCSASETNGKQTFYLFDHFTAQNLTIWDEGSNVGYTDSYVHVLGATGWGTYYMDSDEMFGLEKRVRFKGIINNFTAAEGVTHSSIGFDNHNGGSNDYSRIVSADDDTTKGSNYDTGEVKTADFGLSNTERVYEIQRINSSHVGYFADGDEKVITTQCTSDSLSVATEAYEGYTRIDWLWVHNISSNVITVAFGVEESRDAPPIVTLETPTDKSTDEDGSVVMNCTATDDILLDNVLFWHNGSGAWAQYTGADGGEADGTWDFETYTHDFGSSPRTIMWNCWWADNSSQEDWGDANYTFNIGETKSVSVVLDSPGDDSVNTSTTIQFAFTATFTNTDPVNCSLWTNETSWSKKEDNITVIQDGTATYISETFSSDGTYAWNIECHNESNNVMASSNYTVTIDTTGDIVLNFVNPTQDNGTDVNSDWLYINASSNYDLTGCIFQIDGHNYSMTTNGKYCYLNFTNLGFNGLVDDLSSVWYKDPGNPLNQFPAYTGEFSCHHGGLDDTIHCFYTDQYPAGGFCRANSTDGLSFTLDNSGNEVITLNATANEEKLETPYHYHCTHPNCIADYFLFMAVKNDSNTDHQQIRVMWSDDFYAPEGSWYRCVDPILTTGDSGTWRDFISANPAMVFNGTGWEGVIEMHDGSRFLIGSAYHDDPNPCAAWTWGNGDEPVFQYGSFTGSAQGTGNPWMDSLGYNEDGTTRYIIFPGGAASGKWKPYAFNASNLNDNTTFIQLDTDPLLDTVNSYETVQTADIHCLSTPNMFNNTMCYYVSHDGNPSQSVATTEYMLNELFGAGLAGSGEHKIIIYAKNSSGALISVSRTLNFPGPDITPPVINVDSPDNGTTYTSLPIDINVTVNENANWCGYNLDGGTNTTLSGSGTNWYGEITLDVDQSPYIHVYCNDTSGNMALNDTVTFTYSLADYTESYNTYTYETAEETFSIIFNLSNYDTISNVTASLNWNGTVYSGSSSELDGDIQTISTTITVPDATNDTYVVSFNWNYTIYYIDESTESATAESHDQTVYFLNISNCTSGDVFLYLLLEDEDGGGALTGDIEVDFYIDSMGGGYDTNKSFAFDIDGLSEFSFCFEPTSSTFYVDAIVIYNADGYSQRTHYLEDAALSSSAQNISLLLASNTTTTLVTMEVLDNVGLPVEGVQINIQRYYVGSGTYETIEISETDFQGEAYAYLVLNTVWYRFILIQDGVVLEQYSPMIITEDEITFRLSSGELGEWFQYYDNIAFNCTWPGNTTTCTVIDTSGLMVSSELAVKRWTSLGYIDVCSTSSTSSSSTLVCNMGVLTGRLFWYELTADFASTDIVLESGFKDHRTTPGYGMVGVTAALMLMMVMIFMGIYRWEISLAFCAASVGISSLMGILIVSYGSIVAGFVVVGVAIYKTRSS